MFTLKVTTEQETGDVDQAIQRYDNTLVEMAYAVDHYDGDTKEDGDTHCEAHVGIVTTKMETDAATSESSHENDYVVEDNGTEEEAIALVAQHDDDRLISFIVDSGTQSHNLQDTEAFRLERSKTSATGHLFLFLRDHLLRGVSTP